MGEDKLEVSNLKFYINEEEIAAFDNAIVNYEIDETILDNEKLNKSWMDLSNYEFSFKLADKTLDKYHRLMKKSKSLRIRKKNKKKYDVEFKKKYGWIFGVDLSSVY